MTEQKMYIQGVADGKAFAEAYPDEAMEMVVTVEALKKDFPGAVKKAGGWLKFYERQLYLAELHRDFFDPKDIGYSTLSTLADHAKKLYDLVERHKAAVAEFEQGGLVNYERLPQALETMQEKGVAVTGTNIRAVLEKLGEVSLWDALIRRVSVTAIPIDELVYPVDKLNSVIWKNIPISFDGWAKLPVSTAAKKKQARNYPVSVNGKEAVVNYAVNFEKLDGMTITKALTAYDKRVYLAAAALYGAGNNVVSVTQIHKAMGNKGRPSKNQMQKIDNSLTKLRMAQIFVDSTQEHRIYKRYPVFKYDGDLLPFERGSAYINGELVDAAVHLFREPPLVTFAKDRGQIAKIPKAVLISGINKTDGNLQIEDYLLVRICHMKNASFQTSERILFSTLIEKSGITEQKTRQRVPEKVKAYLAHYKKVGWIAGFTVDDAGATIQLTAEE